MKIPISTYKQGFTLIEILVVIAILAILAAILFPVFGRVREQGNVTVCRSNLRQIGLAMQQYVDDNGRYPFWLTVAPPPQIPPADGPGWAYRIRGYVGSLKLFRCPSSVQNPGTKEDITEADGLKQLTAVHYTDYALNMRASGVEVSRIKAPFSFILLQEQRFPAFPNSSANTYGSSPFPAAHFDQVNNLFADGHIKLIARSNTFAECMNDGTTIPGANKQGLPTFCLD